VHAANKNVLHKVILQKLLLFGHIYTINESEKIKCGIVKKVKVKERIAVNGFPSHSYGTSLAIWDHTVLPATRHK